MAGEKIGTLFPGRKRKAFKAERHKRAWSTVHRVYVQIYRNQDNPPLLGFAPSVCTHLAPSRNLWEMGQIRDLTANSNERLELV